MNPELLKLLEALDAIRESPSTQPERTQRLKAAYESRLDELLERHPNISRQTAQAMVERAYSRWLKAQGNPSAMPPKA